MKKKILILVVFLIGQIGISHVVESSSTKELRSDNVAVQYENIEKDGRIYNENEVDAKPEFPGGMEKFYKYSEITLTTSNNKNSIGKVMLSFIVEANGALSDIKLIRDNANGNGASTLKAIKKMPIWNPAMLNGNAVRYYYPLTYYILAKN